MTNPTNNNPTWLGLRWGKGSRPAGQCGWAALALVCLAAGPMVAFWQAFQAPEPSLSRHGAEKARRGGARGGSHAAFLAADAPEPANQAVSVEPVTAALPPVAAVALLQVPFWKSLRWQRYLEIPEKKICGPP